MDFQEFKRIVKTFAYNPEDVIIEPGRLFLQVNEEIIQADLKYDDNCQLIVNENDVLCSPRDWIVRRLARLDLLAGRIIDHVSKGMPFFVDPKGKMTKAMDNEEQNGEVIVPHAKSSIINILDSKIPGATSVLYLTAAAGEGKTTLIKEIAYEQAEKYKKRLTPWLLVPIELGGRRIIRLDDHIAGSLANTFRFPYLYYGTFVELIKLGVIIPALDGFEEMFVESATRDVLSALGNLLNSLESHGNLLIAARNAYFEYKGWDTQARLHDSISRDIYAIFSRIKLCPWEKEHFCKYASKRGVPNPEGLYNEISSNLGTSHPILTRPVLSKNLCDIAKDQKNTTIRQILDAGSQDYFTNFIKAIVSREANEKWIDVTGDPARPLLSIKQHFELLSDISIELWRDGVDHIREDMLDTIVELYCSQFKDVKVNRQILERIKDHALLKRAEPQKPYYGFDHEEFKNFFLGWAIGRLISDFNINTIKSILRMGQLPPQSLDTINVYVSEQKIDSDAIIYKLNDISKIEGPTSYCRENIGGIISRIITNINTKDRLELNRVIFPSHSIDGISLTNIFFNECYFQPLHVHESQFSQCLFENCTFERIECQDQQLVSIDTKIKDSTIQCYCFKTYDIYDPCTIRKRLEFLGFIFSETEALESVDDNEIEMEPELSITERALRAYRNATQINENTFRQRLGQDANYFIDSILPKLQEEGVLDQIEYRGSGQQRRFKLIVQMSAIQQAFQQCKGRFSDFIKLIKS